MVWRGSLDSRELSARTCEHGLPRMVDDRQRYRGKFERLDERTCALRST